MARGPEDITNAAVVLEPPPRGNGEPCLVMIRGPQLGRRIPLDRPVVTIGRGPACDVVVASGGVSRLHCSLRQEGGVARVHDEGSKNGTWVRRDPVPAGSSLRLASGDVVHAGDVSFKFLDGDDLETAYHEAVYRMMTEDALTQAKNRRYLMDQLDREIARERRNPTGLVLLLIDVDHFKRVNDEAGHLFGDHVLRSLASVVQRSMRAKDLLARYGGDEFALLITDTSRAGGEIFAERLRAATEAETFELDGRVIAATVSIGVGVWGPELASASAFLQLADTALYAAKSAGRNRVAS
jgi:diguanylate cyclase (GGDEF)-like protein